jgi:hypothetical protein
MTHFYEPDLTANPDSPFVRDASNKLVRRAYWIDMPDATLVMVMTKGIGANLPTMKRAHLIDLKREGVIDQVCVQEILPLFDIDIAGKSGVAPLQQPSNFSFRGTRLSKL